MSALFVKDMGKMIHFYKDVMGVNYDWDGGDFAAEDYLLLCTRRNMERDCSQTLTYPEGLNGTIMVCYGAENSEQLDNEYERLRSVGLRSLKCPQKNSDGVRTFLVADPEDNILHFAVVPTESEDQTGIRYLYDALLVKSPKLMSNFYGSLVGLEVKEEGNKYIVNDFDGKAKFIIIDRETIKKECAETLSFPNGINGTMEICLPIQNPDDVAVYYNRLLESGSKGVFQPWTAPWGLRSCFVTDPENNLVEFVAPVD